jgi:hypothetical protein
MWPKLSKLLAKFAITLVYYDRYNILSEAFEFQRSRVWIESFYKFTIEAKGMTIRILEGES